MNNIEFSNKIYKIDFNYIDCLSSIYKWAYIVNDQKTKMLYIDKCILINKDNFQNNRNIFLFVLPSFSIYSKPYLYNKKTYTSVYKENKNTLSHYAFHIFDENKIVKKNDSINYDFF